ncbi:MAG: amino acid permease [Rhodothermales bacterium]
MSDTTLHKAEHSNGSGHGFGTLPVFLAGISTILGAIMFLRFGYAVGNVGLLGSLGIIVIGHLVTIPTALAIAEIATNRKVEGGGEYFIISRSFGTTIGSVIGVSLYLSQAISVAFYMIAFAEAFSPFANQIAESVGFYDPRMISLPATLLLLTLVLTKGAALGVKALYVVVATLVLSLISFFIGSTDYEVTMTLTETVNNPDGFMVVFAICFPAFTGMTAGVGLSGDLANPRKSIPAGTLLATFVGMFAYVFIVFKLAASAPIEMLAEDQLIMGKIAIWGPMILIGLAAATISSALGSILVAPRTIQALGADNSLPMPRLNKWLEKGVGAVNEPRNATLLTGGLAIAIVIAGNVDFVARLISMFFMVTYGSLCAISFLEHFAARPDYRPSFRSRWYVSLFGAVMCTLMMFLMDPFFAILSLSLMSGLYIIVARKSNGKKTGLAAMFEGVMTQANRYMSVRLQERRRRISASEWRPSVIMINSRTFDRRSPLQFMRWICHRYGFGTYLHFIKGHLDSKTFAQSEQTKERLIKQARQQKSPVYMDTVVSPSMISALAQSLQIPGVSGLSNNTILFEFSIHDDDEVLEEVAESCLFSSNTKMTRLVLRHSDFYFGERKSIHIWLTWNDRENAYLMILFSYILLGHPDWVDAEIKVFAAMPMNQLAERRREFQQFMSDGRIPVSEKNIRFLPIDDVDAYRERVSRLSADADLLVVGFDLEGLAERKGETFRSHATNKDVLFVNAHSELSMD